MRSAMIFLSLFILAAVAYAHDPDFDSGSLREGYLEGYKHGSEDSRAGLNFDYKHAPEYQTRTSYSSLNDCEFRLAYVEGYTDGFFRHPSRYRASVPALSVPQPYENFGTRGFATVYDEPGYSGSNSRFQVGKYQALPEGWNDDIESLRISGGVRVILYDEKDFGGEKLVIERDTTELQDFENKAASMMVEPMEGGFATVFKDPGYQGTVREFDIGRYSSLDNDWDDEIESVQLSGNVRIILFDKKDFEGERMIVERDTVDLGDFREKAASMIVEPLTP